MPGSALKAKLLSRNGPVLLYGTTPPRLGTPPERIAEAAHKLAARVRGLPLDGFVVYDLQDESARTHLPRPFPFAPAVDSSGYAKLLGGITRRDAVCYKCVGRMTEPQWRDWLREQQIDLLCPVGRPTSAGAPFPMTLSGAIQIASEAGCTLGGIAIAERHDIGVGEVHRMMKKTEMGCGFFVSQAVYHAEPTIELLADYAAACRRRGAAPKRVVLTFAPCGREKTMAFMKWLGVSIPPAVERSILSAASPLLRSLEICRANLRRIIEHACADEIPLGVNTESVSINKDEIDASVDLFHGLREVLEERVPA